MKIKDLDEAVDKMILEEFGFPEEVIENVKDLDAFIKEAKSRAVADQGKAEKILQFLGMDVSELGGEVVDQTAVALDKLIDWVSKKAKGKEKMSPRLQKLKRDAEKRRGKKMESLSKEEQDELDDLRQGLAFIQDNDDRREAMDRIRELQKREETPCPAPGAKVRSGGKGRGMAVGKGRGPIGRRGQ